LAVRRDVGVVFKDKFDESTGEMFMVRALSGRLASLALAAWQPAQSLTPAGQHV
jgi:hypothetical protein